MCRGNCSVGPTVLYPVPLEAVTTGIHAGLVGLRGNELGGELYGAGQEVILSEIPTIIWKLVVDVVISRWLITIPVPIEHYVPSRTIIHVLYDFARVGAWSISGPGEMEFPLHAVVIRDLKILRTTTNHTGPSNSPPPLQPEQASSAGRIVAAASTNGVATLRRQGEQ